jgi:hypothetical protein
MSDDKIIKIKYDVQDYRILHMEMSHPTVPEEIDFIKIHGFYPTNVDGSIIECYIYDMKLAEKKMIGGLGVAKAIRNYNLKSLI